MLGKCFSFLCITSFVFAIFTKNMSALSSAIIDGASKGVTLTLSLIGIMALWKGIMEVLKQGGAIKFLSRILRPVLKPIFPNSFGKNQAAEEITACISANILGISNASTPLAINAMKKMGELRKSDAASNDMIMLSLIGCSSFCLIPTTVLALRQASGASINYEIIPVVWIVSGACMLISIALCRILGAIYGDA